MAGERQQNPKTLQEIFFDFRQRRTGLLRALTRERQSLFNQCSSDDADLCLFGYPNGDWEVKPLIGKVAQEFPGSSPGINFGLGLYSDFDDWVSFVAKHSDAWLLALAFHHATNAKLDKYERIGLYSMIEDTGLLSKEVRAAADEKGKAKGKSIPPNYRGETSKSTPDAAEGLEEHAGGNEEAQHAEGGEGEGVEDDSQNICGTCGVRYVAEEGHFWIGCDSCYRWFHGWCVNMTAELADGVDLYECPTCRNDS